MFMITNRVDASKYKYLSVIMNVEISRTKKTVMEFPCLISNFNDQLSL